MMIEKQAIMELVKDVQHFQRLRDQYETNILFADMPDQMFLDMKIAKEESRQRLHAAEFALKNRVRQYVKQKLSQEIIS